MEVKTVAVVGAGEMGHGIAELFAMHGFTVRLEDIAPEILQNALSRIRESLEKLSRKNALGGETVEGVLGRISTHTDLESACRGVDLVVEAAPEVEELKAKIFRELERLTAPEAILASNTSNIRITDLARGLKKPDRVAGLHFFNPAVLMRLVEVIRGEETSEEVIQTLMDLARRLGKVPVRVGRDTPGFIVNRINAPEMLFFGLLLDHGVATSEEVDAFARLQGLPMGPYELFDFVGLDIVHHSLEYFARTLSPEYGKCRAFRERVQKGQLGKKTGRGFYDWSAGRPTIDTKKSTDKVSLMDVFAIEINEAVRLLEEGVASPEDIETAVKLGLNRPFGPISAAKSLTNTEVKAKLEELRRRFGCAVFEPAETIKRGLMREAVEGRLAAEAPRESKPAEAAPYKTLTVEKFGFKVARVTLNRPKHNTINAEMLDELEEAIDRLWGDPDVNVVLVTGQGSTFSAGAELSQFFPEAFQFLEFARKGGRVFRKLSEIPKLTIAALKGYALGGGLELALACDLRVATEDVQLGLPEVTLGLVPAWGGSQRLAKLVGASKAAELVLTGVRISGKEAYAAGLVNRLFQDVDRESLEFARSVAEAAAPISVALAKRLLNKGGEVPMDVGLEMESMAAGVVFGTQDLREGVAAFLQKRKPQFQGR